MKPELSKLQCSSAFITELSVKANLDFTPKDEGPLDFEKLDVETTVTAHDTKESHWQVALKVIFDSAAVENAPYSFTIELIGFFSCNGIKTEDQQRFVEIQASSILYGMARDALLDAMTKGPWNSIFLPLATFYKPKPKAENTET